ncbi:S-locus lectin protein kinase family protein, partial [Striga asiatica]
GSLCHLWLHLRQHRLKLAKILTFQCLLWHLVELRRYSLLPTLKLLHHRLVLELTLTVSNRELGSAPVMAATRILVIAAPLGKITLSRIDSLQYQKRPTRNSIWNSRLPCSENDCNLVPWDVCVCLCVCEREIER